MFMEHGYPVPLSIQSISLLVTGLASESGQSIMNPAAVDYGANPAA
jgi:hypothetical protein